MERVDHVTAAGSRVKPVGAASWTIQFDWFEEGACVEAVPELRKSERRIAWSCPCCDCSGGAELTKSNG